MENCLNALGGKFIYVRANPLEPWSKTAGKGQLSEVLLLPSHHGVAMKPRRVELVEASPVRESRVVISRINSHGHHASAIFRQPAMVSKELFRRPLKEESERSQKALHNGKHKL